MASVYDVVVSWQGPQGWMARRKGNANVVGPCADQRTAIDQALLQEVNVAATTQAIRNYVDLIEAVEAVLMAMGPNPYVFRGSIPVDVISNIEQAVAACKNDRIIDFESAAQVAAIRSLK